MHSPAAFRMDDIALQLEVIRRYPFATLITPGGDGASNNNAAGNNLQADHIPLLITPAGGAECEPQTAAAGEHGVQRWLLRGHLARANPVWRQWRQDREVLAVFHGPQRYISPAWYATKTKTHQAKTHQAERHRVVPTWNFISVHVNGRPRAVRDAAWLRQMLDDLTRQEEAHRPDPWHLSDADPVYMEQLLNAVVGIEIEVTRIVGKAKLSQNQPPQNRASVQAGLTATGLDNDRDMLAWMGRFS